MKEHHLLKIALICSLIGLAVLYFISIRIEIKEYKPNTLNKNIGDDVKLKGTITKITDKGDVVFIEVAQLSPVTIVLFSNDDNLKLNKGDNIEVTGELQEYNGKDEVIAEKIRVMR